jgi:alginate O-acetyltransferase complex protein AlgI
MAIGLGKMMGFRFLENFNYPYISQNITEFWRRWHISLGTWFREYVYIPLGGNRGGLFKMYRNIFVVWFLTGFWHGADWNFIIWGLYYFVLLVVEKTFLLERMKKWPQVFRHIYTLFFVYFGWLIFVFDDMGAGASYLGTMFGVGSAGFISSADIYSMLHKLVFVAILVIASVPKPRELFYKFYEKSKAFRYVAAVGALLVTVLVTAYLVDSSYNPFLYFRF